jgi:phage gp29-like protein
MRDMATYLEVFGVPATFLVGPPGISVEKELEYLRIAEDLVNNGRGYLPNGSDIKYVTGGGGKAPFFEALAYLDKMVTMVGTGGLLTMLSESGTGTLAGSAHADTFLQVARGDAVTLSEVLQKDLDGPLLEMAFPGAPHLAYFEVSPTVPDQAARVLQDVGQLAAAGLQVDPAEVSEKTGYRLLPAGVGG